VLIFGGVLSPTLGFFDVYWFLYSFVADHFQYHACMALIALAAAAAVHWAGSLSENNYRLAIGAAALLLLVLAGMAHYRTYAFKDNESIIRDNIAGNPGAWAGHNNLGDWLRDHGQHEEALAQYREAARLFPQRHQLHNNIGRELISLGRSAEAAAAFQEALAGYLDDEQLYIAHTHLFQWTKANGQAAESREHVAAAMHAAVRLTPDNPQVREDAGATFLAMGDLPESEKHLRRAVELRPDAASSRELLGDLLARKGDRDGAIREYQAALKIDPQNAAAAAGLQELQAGAPTPKK
jgi:tetratricopeptide (TPR) repeat protein